MKKLGKIVILGGTGFIGSQLSVKLSPLCNKLSVLTRNVEANKDLKLIPNLELIHADVLDERSLNAELIDSNIVINTIGILNETDDENTFKNLHYELIKKISNAIKRNKIKRYLHISSLNAHPNALSQYLVTKGLAENYIRDNMNYYCNTTIFRPSIVFGEHDSFFNKFSTILKFSPIFPLACPNSKFMPIYVSELTDFIIDSISDSSSYGKLFDVTGPKEYTFRELINITLSALKIKRIIIPLNYGLSKLQANIFQRLPGQLFTLDNFLSLQVDSCSTEGLKGKLSIEDIVPGYLNITLKQKHFENLRKKAGRSE
ncbi:MAG: complex I NDUFA9 subunit family protein [Gammaproteobacteria bacterium]|jgi:nucleoside-diphosphate-sugar epimerase|nr:complex I NDUFA9 subunit family protein [Gammaproteobacteria bacterium]MBT4462558.1 complex I NDUFA9 subunit family protein [Gammaproteobacteria bacterium]MBT4654805.1 complex I NDUFA9 subunit family protein [Gammaproteobacteria bacterium]MBT5116810.1 complex I NDUFA9 subunit family protein [Gammaproteobacteria bacterium]MBT5761678.1 complex I NDUFA9 subunit family protein [Gammaproteobacteria bacterium]